MITIKNVTKIFDHYTALNQVTLSIPKGEIYGLVGTNGSGKSTLLRLIAGVYKPDQGELSVDHQPVWENPTNKNKIIFVSDDLFFLSHATLDSMANFYRPLYPRWNQTRYEQLLSIFKLGRDQKISTFSKGMKRQAALILALSASPEYLLLDEAFDGLDPVVRFAVRQILSDMMYEEKITVIISSHNLRELEDFCNIVTLIHQGNVIFNCDMENISSQFVKAQLVFKQPITLLPNLDVPVLSHTIRGSVVTVICKCSQQELQEKLSPLDLHLWEAMPLNLEEVFIYEMEAAHYEYKNILF